MKLMINTVLLVILVVSVGTLVRMAHVLIVILNGDVNMILYIVSELMIINIDGNRSTLMNLG